MTNASATNDLRSRTRTTTKTTVSTTSRKLSLGSAAAAALLGALARPATGCVLAAELLAVPMCAGAPTAICWEEVRPSFSAMNHLNLTLLHAPGDGPRSSYASLTAREHFMLTDPSPGRPRRPPGESPPGP